MAGETVITVVGNLTSDPELRYTPNGVAVANFTIASTPRTFNRATNQWEDGEALFLRASIWRDYAENVAESLKKGTRVIAQGRLKSRTYETKEGERRTSFELELEEIGPALRYATANVARSARGNGAGGNFAGAPQSNFGGDNGFGGGAAQGYAPQQQSYTNNGYSNANGFNSAPAQQSAPAPQQAQPQSAPAADPWSSQAGGNYSWGTGAASDEPPF